MQFKKEGKRQWELAYEDSTRATLSRFIIANADGKRLFSVDAIGTTEALDYCVFQTETAKDG